MIFYFIERQPMKKKNPGFLKVRTLILSLIAFSLSLMAAAPASAAITNPKPWSLVYGGTAYTGTYTYLVPAVKNRVLVVAVSSLRSTAGTQTTAVTYGGQALTLAIGDAGTSARQHTYLFYLNEAKMRAASTTDLVVTVSGGTSTYNQVYAAVYAGVNQTTPITNSKNYNSGSGLLAANTTVGPFASALTIGAGDLAVEIVNITSSTTNVTRTITGWAANWSSVIGPNAPATNINRPSAYIATNATAGTTTSLHTADNNCWDSMSAMTLNSLVPPEFTSINHTEVNIGENRTFTVTADGSPAPTLSLSGDLPSGMTFTPATGILSGTPDPGMEGTHALTFTAANGVSPDATQSFTLTVTPRFPIGWHYRKCHVINQADGAGTGYQVRITAHYGDDAGGSNDSGENVYLNSHCRTDFSDVRFVSSDGVTELNYWMETGSLIAGDSAAFWVKVNEDLSAANRTIYIYYGNAAATTTSNGDNTFSFFDDFDDTLSKWVLEKTIDGSYITINAAQSYVRCGGGITSGTFGHSSLGSSPSFSNFTDGAIEVRLRQSANSLGEIAYRGDFGANTGYKGRYDCRTGTESPHMRPPYYGWAAFGTAVTRFGIGTDTWYRGTVTATTSGSPSLFDHQIFRNGVLMSSVTDATYAGPGEIALQNHYGTYSDYDWVAVRKYVNPEPAQGSWCAEEVLAVNLYSTKSVALAVDADGNGAITPGDTMRYNVRIYNTGNVAALGVVLTDLLPTETTYTGPWTATNGAVTYSGGQVSWTGSVAADSTGVIRTEITFDVTVNALTPIGTVVSNQGSVAYDSNNDGTNEASIFTDGDPFAALIQATLFTVGGSAQATGIKTVALAVDADANGVISPGDTLEYTIVITNMTGFPSAGIEISDVIPAYTTYVTASTIVEDRDGTSTTSEPSPPTNPGILLITGITIGPAGSPFDVVTIKFRVTLDKPMAPGVTQISNQGVGFYDSNSDGVNDTHQRTDGDLGTVGNQPTVANIYVGTISGTVFDDLNGNASLDVGEPGLSGVTVELYNALFTLLYGTATTDINGYYVFTGTAITAGTYGVRETDPPTYVSTTPNDVTVTLGPTPSTGDSATDVNFGDHPPGHADLEIEIACQTVFAGESGQLVFLITLANNGPDAATSVVLTDIGLSAIPCLSNLNYIVDSGALMPWPGTDTLSWPSLAPGESHVIQIFADVSTTPSPCENIVTVTSGTNDPVPGNNASSCTGSLSPVTRGAVKFENPACTTAASTCPPGNFHVSVPDNISNSLDLTTSGTIEAWIQASSLTASDADAGIVFKGTTPSSTSSYGLGLAGGTLFSGGTARNIGFRVGGTVLVADGYTLIPGKWYHVACTWSASGMNIYINGILEKSNSIAAVATPNDEELMIGQQMIEPTSSSGQYFGVVEEFRLWDTALAQADIQNDMCRTLTMPASGLVCYLKYDEASGTAAVDSSGNANNGDTTHASRVCSGAPVGDEAATPDYSGTAPADYLASFTSASGETVTVTGGDGTWSDAPATSPPYKSGLQLYRVNGAPEPANGPMGSNLFGDRGYWGVFVTGGDAPTYSLTYAYNPADIGDETGLDLMYRHEGCAPWMHLNAIHGSGTLTKTGMSGTEYILGKTVDPRNAVAYDGTDDYVNVPDDATLQLTDTGTLEAWIYVTAFPAVQGSIISKGDTNDGYDLSIDSTGNVLFSLYTSGPPISTTTVTTTAPVIALNTWYHVSATWDGIVGAGHSNYMSLYINGVLDPDPATASTQVSGDTTGSPLTIGSDGINDFTGAIDEVRVWDIARSRDAIRATMCKKVISTDSGFANLMGYWRFDEETADPTCPDETSNNNIGTMDESPGFSNNGGTHYIEDARICSSAPIGDDSAFGYYDGGALSPVTAQLAHTDGDYMEVTENTTNGANWTDTFSGLHIYRLDEAPVYPPDLWNILPLYPYISPNGLTPPVGPPAWSSIDYYRYWGVFVTDWDGVTNQPEYDVVYHYAGNPLTPDIDSVVGLARRPEYCFGTWSDSGAALDSITNNTLTLTADYQFGTATAAATNPEYVFGGKDAPLAITLASFTATPDAGCVEVAWETATELNTAGFHVWRSDNPLTGFVRVTSTLIPSKSVMETVGSKYSFRDCGVDLTDGKKYYYMLEEVEINGKADGNMHGPIGPVSEVISAAQKTESSSGSNCFIDSLIW